MLKERALSALCDQPSSPRIVVADPEESDALPRPQVGSHLDSCLYAYREQYEEQFAESEDAESARITSAIDRLERYALELVTTGLMRDEIREVLQDFQPEDTVPASLHELLSYRTVHDRIEFDVAERVVNRLVGADNRIAFAILAITLLTGHNPSPTALKYFKRTMDLYLAGYTTEVIIMAGAVLEAAIAHRIPDELLAAAGNTATFRNTGIFPTNERLKYARDRHILTGKQFRYCKQVMTWRNDAVHVQPDIGPNPEQPLLLLAFLLPAITRQQNPG